MNKILVDTSGKGLSATVCDDEANIIASVSVRLENKLSEKMMSVMDFIFKTSQLSPQDIDKYYIVTGPGSFTGIRIGVGSLLGFCLSCGKKLEGISSLDAAAIISGKESVKTAVKLRGRLYGFREYSFSDGIFSGFQTEKMDCTDDFYVINSGGRWDDLSKAVLSDRFHEFITDYSPMYMRASEAEINFDKRSRAC
ncbi:peptidase M22 glycoprotease [Denitrovibrio acetiphilus DSM 12809]|uniref:Peptidase M22 glycoprotease n=1 Tax=Denitrovibrio acetiphilus (strain DSM 12809 / NBRC 114555 / N2460) TaxID=522772 RepID=D4H866_DENA2|nr:tRNA (adenosine(37)-N6)-threonylcarbamoyltransferase complex dimerization subunit type 1 TsaB [Denitrovibrio acetiphilus]ADD68215.1 peptidase M22 glycoprotease [Denitrovibrio acetiphilus DSM 12809]